MSAGRGRRLERAYLRGRSAMCCLCGRERAFRRGSACQDCQRWLDEYNGHTLYNRDRLLVRQIHALRLRAEQHLPLFEGGKLCV